MCVHMHNSLHEIHNIQRNEFSLQVTCLSVFDETAQLESSPLIVEVSRCLSLSHTYTRARAVGLL